MRQLYQRSRRFFSRCGHPIAIQRWRSFLFDDSVEKNKAEEAITGLMYLLFCYVYLIVLEMSVLQTAAFYVFAVGVQFLLWYRENAEVEMRVEEVLD